MLWVAFVAVTGSDGGGSAPMLHSRPIAVGPLRVTVTASDPDIIARWDDLYAGFAEAEPARGAEELRVSIGRNATGALVSMLNGIPLLEHPDLAAHELEITRVLNHRKLDSEPDRVHLHAAGVARDGRAVVMVGRSGDGKSTLTARLVGSGWEYVTDEQITFDREGSLIEPYPRPLTLRQGVWHLFEGIGGERQRDDYHRVETSLRELGGRAAGAAVLPCVVLAPQYRRSATNSLIPFANRADVVDFLVSCCHDTERLGAEACAVLVGIASRCPAWHLHFDDVEVASALVASAWGQAAGSPVVGYRRLPGRSASAGTGRGWCLAADSVAWAFDDGSGVAYQPTTRRFARLDTLGIALWEILAEPTPASVLLADSPDEATGVAVETWLEMLAASGLAVRS